MQDIEVLYKKYAKQVYKYLFSLCHNDQTAEELTQETFFRAIKSLKKYDGTCKINVWLCQIAKHIWYQELDKRRRSKISNADYDIPAKDSSIEDKFILKDEKMNFFKELHLLEDPMREVMYLRLTGEFSFKEIGEILKKNETWARVTYYRGKQKIMRGREK